MEQIHQQSVARKRADKFSNDELILVAHSNAISGPTGSSFATMPVEVKKILGIKKALIE